MIEMTVEGIKVSIGQVQRCLMLREKAGERFLQIWIGSAEAEDIERVMSGQSNSRPTTQDLLASVLKKFAGTIIRVVINDLTNDTFYARIVFRKSNRLHEEDARPSDAVAIALRLRVPLFVEEKVLAKARDRREVGESSERVEQPTPANAERPSAFVAFIESLELDDFDDRRR